MGNLPFPYRINSPSPPAPSNHASTPLRTHLTTPPSPVNAKKHEPFTARAFPYTPLPTQNVCIIPTYAPVCDSPVIGLVPDVASRGDAISEKFEFPPFRT